MHARFTLVRIETRRVATVARQHPACTGESDIPMKKEAACPAGELESRGEFSTHDAANLAIAAIIHPDFFVPQASRMRPRETSAHHFTGGAAEDDASTIDGEVEVSRS